MNLCQRRLGSKAVLYPLVLAWLWAAVGCGENGDATGVAAGSSTTPLTSRAGSPGSGSPVVPDTRSSQSANDPSPVGEAGNGGVVAPETSTTASASRVEETGGTTGAPHPPVPSIVASGGAADNSQGGSGEDGLAGTTSNIAGEGNASEGGAGGMSGEPLGELAVSDLAIEPNPRMSLSAYVSWTTSEPANSEVQFGIGGVQLRIVDATERTEHRVHVVGMHPETTYVIQAISTNQTATGSAEGEFTTGSVPANLPAEPLLVAYEPDKMQPGWTLTNYQVGGSSNFSTEPAIIVMLDEEGLPVWYFVHGSSADQFGMTSTDFLPNGHILIGNASAEPAREVDWEGNVVWEGPTGGNPSLSHHTSKLSTGNYLVVRESNSSARVEEINPDNQIVWTWDLYDHVQPQTTAADWCHLNAVSVDEVRDILYFNCRFQGLYAVSRGSGEILWQMGAAIDNSSAGDVTYLPDNSARFNDAHDPEVHDDGKVLFYDNQGWANHMGGEGNGTFHSQVVEYVFDEARKEAMLSWQFPGDFAVDPWFTEEWQTPIWGDADRLPNDNVLVTAGARGAGTVTRIFEVTRAGEVVWCIEWPENNGSYRADRITPPVERIP